MTTIKINAKMSDPVKLDEKQDDTSSPVRDEQTETKVEKDGLYDIVDAPADKLSAVFENPLANVSREKLFQDVEAFCTKFNLMDHLETFQKGALISQNPAGALDLVELDEADKNYIRREATHKWSQPFALYSMVCKCSLLLSIDGAR